MTVRFRIVLSSSHSLNVALSLGQSPPTPGDDDLNGLDNMSKRQRDIKLTLISHFEEACVQPL